MINHVMCKKWMLAAVIGAGGWISNARADQTELAWPEPQVENRPGSYWWWMGSAVDKENITYNL